MSVAEDLAQAWHERAQAADPDRHESSSCWCCCWSCDPDAAAPPLVVNPHYAEAMEAMRAGLRPTTTETSLSDGAS